MIYVLFIVQTSDILFYSVNYFSYIHIFFINNSQEKAHYDGVMQRKVLPDIKEAEAHYLELKQQREVHYDIPS